MKTSIPIPSPSSPNMTSLGSSSNILVWMGCIISAESDIEDIKDVVVELTAVVGGKSRDAEIQFPAL